MRIVPLFFIMFMVISAAIVLTLPPSFTSDVLSKTILYLIPILFFIGFAITWGI